MSLKFIGGEGGNQLVFYLLLFIFAVLKTIFFNYIVFRVTIFE